MVRTAPLPTVADCAKVCVMFFAHETLAKRRLVAGLSRDQLAEASGISRETIRRVELGVFTPRVSTALALASALELDVNDLWSVGERAA
jgi:DNA-binding XRE family transcriptional regulator